MALFTGSTIVRHRANPSLTTAGTRPSTAALARSNEEGADQITGPASLFNLTQGWVAIRCRFHWSAPQPTQAPVGSRAGERQPTAGDVGREQHQDLARGGRVHVRGERRNLHQHFSVRRFPVRPRGCAMGKRRCLVARGRTRNANAATYHAFGNRDPSPRRHWDEPKMPFDTRSGSAPLRTAGLSRRRV
jgi:hypothetical protein